MSKHVTVRLNRRGSHSAAGLLAPHRGDQVEAWLKARRDEQHPEAKKEPGRARAAYSAIDDLLDEYRLRADLGLTIDAEIPEEDNR